MNQQLHALFSMFWKPETSANQNGGVSSISGTENLRQQILDLLRKYSIVSVFDAGCNDCGWMSLIIPYVKYQGGDISAPMIKALQRDRPDLNVILHDATTDPLPNVDLLFSRDLTIHLSTKDKLLFWKNWYTSGVPWILTTHVLDCGENIDVTYHDQEFPFAAVNWQIAPWNFPSPRDQVWEYNPNGRCLALWHRDQFKGIL